jgi:hypothetical protein
MTMFTNKLNIMVPVFGVMIALIEPALAGVPSVPAPVIGAGCQRWRSWPVDIGL